MKRKSRTVVIIQARMGSSRLPGKVLERIGRFTLLEHVVRRSRLIRSVDEVVVATSTSDLDDATPLKDYLEPQFRAASDSDASVTYRLNFDPPLPVNDKAQEALVQRLTRLVSPVAHVLAVVAEKQT